MRSRLVQRYLIIFFVGGLFTSIVVFFSAMVNGNLSYNFWIFRCDASGYSDTHYLSYCADPAYGDYEHLAMYGGLEPEAIRHLKKADILFLGNSKTRRAFSAAAVDAYFDPLDLQTYNLGFGYGEYDIFPRALIQKHQLAPRVMIINADYFFYNSMSIAAKDAVADVEDDIGFAVRLKKNVQKWHRDYCGSSDKSTLLDMICQQNSVSLFRSRIDGDTIFLHIDESSKIPAKFIEQPRDIDVDVYIKNAKRFLAGIRIEPRCVFLTVIPSVVTDRRVAQEVSTALQLSYVETAVTSYTTYDGNHLGSESAEAWVSEFLKIAGSDIVSCAQQ